MSTAYAETLQQLEQDLYAPPRCEFPLQIELGGRQYSIAIWQGEQLADRLLAYDVETDTDSGELALATAYGDQSGGYFVHPSDLPQFIRQHAAACWCCHNASFDFWATASALQSDPQAVAAWWDIAGDARLYCTMLGDELIRLARIDAEPIARGLDKVASDYCGMQLDKSDPYRQRYGELIGLPTTAWAQADRGFWEYAAKDPIATLEVAQRQIAIANQLIEPHRRELLPDALRRFGPLTCCLQTQGAIALAYVSRAGVQLDLPLVRRLQHDIGGLVEQHRRELEELAGCSLFKRYGPRSKHAGELQRTAAGVPPRDAKAIKHRLEQIAGESEQPLRPPRVQDGSVTDAVRFWTQHQHIDPLVQAYVAYSQQAKLSQFFRDLQTDRIYPRYRPLVRTGRTSCSRPNLQQLPRDARFREMIIAAPGHWLLQIDYSVLELRTLAQICLRRYGRSTLADLFRSGVDPHRYTAALLLGQTLEQFGQLPPADQKQHRQRAKAINFGVPGGLGAASLVAYAKHSYGVQLSIEQARQFRRQLVERIYPELAAYLRDDQHRDLADNLHCDPQAVRALFSKRDQLTTAARIISGCTATPRGKAYAAELVGHVWQTLRTLNRNPQQMPDLLAAKPSTLLMRRLFWGSAATISGRLRGHVGYTQRANTPFQGLAADGNKLALFRLLRAGYRVCGFVHDEMLVLIPDGADYQQAVEQVQQILIDAMQELAPDIPIACEYLLADRWYKDAPPQPRDNRGRIVPYVDEALAERAAIIWADEQPEEAQAALDKASSELQQMLVFREPEEKRTPKAKRETSKQHRQTSSTQRPQLVQPLKWHGGKHYMAKHILDLMPEHSHYTEPFAGGLSVLLAKPCEGISEAVNDLHGELANFWQVLADPQQFDQFYRRIECTPLSQPQFEAANSNGADDSVSRAVRFFIRCRQSRQGLQRDYTTPTRRTRRGMSEQVSAWLTAVAGLPQVHHRLMRVEIRNLPAVQFIQRYDHPQAVHYCDPPYLHSTRSSTGEYACEMSEQEHRELLECLAGIAGRFILSGYPSELYQQYAERHNWRCEQVEIDNKASSAKQKQIKTECLWMNYEA